MRKSFIATILSTFFVLFCACNPQNSLETGGTENTPAESVTEEDSEDIEESSDTESEEETKVYRYECKLTFFVNPRLDGEANESEDEESQYGVYGAYGQHVMDNMVKLLSSDIFAEKVATNMQAEMKEINGFVTYSYYTYFADDSTALTGSYIYVKISVPEGKGLAYIESLADSLSKEVVEFVEKNIAVPSGYDGTKCVLTKCEEIRKKEK